MPCRCYDDTSIYDDPFRVSSHSAGHRDTPIIKEGTHIALAWITQVKNDSNFAFTLFQNDPTKHPVYNGCQFLPDEPIHVSPRSTMDFSWFVIPWHDYGRLLVRGPSRNVIWQVVPFVNRDKDTLQGRLAKGGVVQNVDLGDLGGPLLGDQIEFQLNASNTGIKFERTGAGVGYIVNWSIKLVSTVYKAIA